MEQSLNYYQIFYTVARFQSISEAATHLFISQPAVSKSIQKLEDSLQTRLFFRSSRGVSLTKEGQLLYEHVKDAFHSLELGEELLKEELTGAVTTLSIGVSTTLCKYILLPHLQAYLANNPQVKINISCQSSIETLELLEHEEIDIGLIGISAVPEAINYMPLCDIHDIFITNKDYYTKEAHGASILNHELLQSLNYILLNKENLSRKYLDSYLDAEGLKLNHIIEVNNMDLAIDFARHGLGIACAIGKFIKAELASGSLREMKLSIPMKKRQIGFVYQNHHKKKELFADFVQFYRNQLVDF